MTRLILDYYRRWGLVFSLGVALQLMQGWWITADARTPIEFTASMIPVCLGLIPLFDLSRGVVRVVGTLPLSLAKLGRGWWLANVLIPAIILAALLFPGAGAAVFCYPDKAFPLNRLLMASLVTALWLGAMFSLVFPAIFPVTGKFRNRWRGILAVLVGTVLTIFFIFWAIFGFVLSPGASKDPAMLAIFLAGGTCLTFVGWFRAGRFNPAGIRVQFGRLNPELSEKFYAYKAGAASSRPTPLSAAPHQPPDGYGGIPFLLRTTFIDRLVVCFASGIGILIFASCASRFPGLVRLPMHGQGMFEINLQEGSKIDNSTITVLLIFTLFPLRSSLTQLRFLRTLPISTAKLAAVIIASVILPAIALGMLMAGIAALAVGTPAALTILNSCLLILAPIALCVFFTAWRGGGIQAYVFFIVTMMAWVLAASASQNIKFPLAGVVAVAGVMLAWTLTYYALLRSSRACRVRTDPLGNFPWSAGR